MFSKKSKTAKNEVINLKWTLLGTKRVWHDLGDWEVRNILWKDSKATWKYGKNERSRVRNSTQIGIFYNKLSTIRLPKGCKES